MLKDVCTRVFASNPRPHEGSAGFEGLAATAPAHDVLGCFARPEKDPMRRREFISLVGAAAARRAARCARAAAGTTRRRAHVFPCGRSGRAGPAERIRGGAAAVGLDRRPQREDRSTLACGRCRTQPIRGGAGRAGAGRHPCFRQRERGGVAADYAQRADRVCECHRSGWRWVRREPLAAGRQHHRISLVRIQPERKMARTAQGDCAQPDAGRRSSRPRSGLPESASSRRSRPWRRRHPAWS